MASPTPLRLDAHQHFWVYDEAQYGWIPRGSPLHGDRLPPNLEPLLKSAALDGSIAVQARQSLEESRWLLVLANQFPSIKGVVGWVDLQSDTVEADLAKLRQHPRFVGVRHVVQSEPDDRFLLRPAFMRGLRKLHHFGLTYDLLLFPKQLPAAIELVRQFPEQPFVLDHLAKPFIKAGTLSPWREQIRELAQAGNVYCKVSGMVTEADPHAWQPADFRPYLDTVVEAFGWNRLMYGSDWPVCLLAGSYERVYGLARDYVATESAAVQAGFFGGVAAQFYGVK